MMRPAGPSPIDSSVEDLPSQTERAPAEALSLEDSKSLLALCRAGKLYEIEDWIMAGKPLRVSPSVRKTPLGTAIETGFHSLIVLLVRNETNVEVLNRTLADAVEHRRLEVIELLITHGAEVSSVPFVDVLHSWDPKIIRLFLDRGADAITGVPLAVAFGEKIRTSLRVFGDYRKADPSLSTALQEQADRALGLTEVLMKTNTPIGSKSPGPITSSYTLNQTRTRDRSGHGVGPVRRQSRVSQV